MGHLRGRRKSLSGDSDVGADRRGRGGEPAGRKREMPAFHANWAWEERARFWTPAMGGSPRRAEERRERGGQG